MADDEELLASGLRLREALLAEGDAESVDAFVDQIVYAVEVPPWETAQALIFTAAEPAGADFGDAFVARISDTVCTVLVFVDAEAHLITPITPHLLEGWQVTREDAEQAAARNMAWLLDGLHLETREIDGYTLGLVPLDSVLKASIIFAPNFKAFATARLRWPVLAVIPSRDFILLLAETDLPLLNRLGDLVRQEYHHSPHPLTLEVLRIADDGITALGRFPE